MRISIDAEKLATKLADESVSFKAEQKTFVEVGMNYTKKDVREQDEWKELYFKYMKVILDSGEI